MKKIFTILFFFFTPFALNIKAQNANTNEILTVAYNFVKNQKKLEPPTPIFANSNKKILAFVVNLKPKGFVIVSASKNIYPIIAYSYENDFNFNQSHSNILLNLIKNDLGCLYKSVQKKTKENNKFIENNQKEWNKLLNSKSTKSTIVAQYGPSIPSVWGGVNCYDQNGNIIYVGNYFTPNHYSPGCVATSLSQILFRYQWPVHGIGSHTDNDNSGSSQGSYYANFGNMYYDWHNMLNQYQHKSSTDQQRRACGRLQYHCGVALDMDYENNGSTSNVNKSPNALSSYFRYIGHYETTSWSSFWSRLDENLQDSMPVQLAIKDASNNAGHAIATDGYRLMDNGDKYYHLNMGFWGSCNAWYRIRSSFDACGYDVITAGVFDILPVPEIVANTNNRTCDEKTFWIKWRVSKKIKWDCFELQQSSDNGNSWTSLDDNITDTAYLVNVANEGQKYEYRVRTKYNGHWYVDSWSNIISVYVKNDLTYIDFDGNDSFFINDNSNNDLDVSNKWTFEFWLKADNLPVSYPNIFDRRYSYSMYMLDIGSGSGDYTVKFVARNSNDAIIASLSSSENNMYFGKWYHVAVTNDGSKSRLFINGVLTDSSTDADFNFSPSTKTLNIGARYWSSGYERYINAKLDQFIISDTARYTKNFTPDRYDRPKIDKHTRIQLNMDKGYGTYLYDATGNFSPVSFRSSPNDCSWLYESYRTNWTGNTSSNWSDPNNWSDGVPDMNKNARILSTATYMPIINANISVKNIFIETNAKLTVNPAYYLKVEGMVCNSGTLTLQSPPDSTKSAMLLDTGAIEGAGTYIAKRTLIANQWNYFSIPTQNATTQQFTATGFPFNPNLYFYNTQNIDDNWLNGWTYAYPDKNNSAQLNVMQGYAFFIPDKNFTAQFSGKFNTGKFSINTYISQNSSEISSHTNWNLVGNPYPSAIDWDAPNAWIKNNIDNSIYLWNGYNYSYYVGNSGNDYHTGIGVNNGSNIIPPMQAFFVKASADGFLQINNNARTTSNHDFYKYISKEPANILKISCSSGKYTDQTAFRILKNATDDFDKKFDAYKLSSNLQYVPQISTSIKEYDIKYAINSISDNFDSKEIFLNLYLPEYGEYSLIVNQNSFSSQFSVFLLDSQNDSMINLKLHHKYNFSYNNPNLNDRFRILIINNLYKKTKTSSDNIKIYSFGKNIIIKINPDKIENNYYLKIYDLTGRMINSSIISQKFTKIQLNNSPGIYIIKLKSNNFFISKKLFIDK